LRGHSVPLAVSRGLLHALMKFKERDRGRSLWVRDFTSHRHGVRLDWARRSQGGALVAKVLIKVHKMLIKVLIGREMSILEKSRVSLQGAHPLQGAHLDLSTLENPEPRSTLKSAKYVVRSLAPRFRHRVSQPKNAAARLYASSAPGSGRCPDLVGRFMYPTIPICRTGLSSWGGCSC
jgi:hypothetical protein